MTRKFPTRGKAVATTASPDLRETIVGAVRRSRSLNFSELEITSSPVIRFDEIPASPCSPPLVSPLPSPADLPLLRLRFDTGSDATFAADNHSVASAPPSARGLMKGSVLQHRALWNTPFSLPVPETSSDAEPAPDLLKQLWLSPHRQAADLADDDVTTFHDVEKQFERQILEQDLTFRFAINYQCMPGECIRVVGSAGPLGEWNAQTAPCMIWHHGDEWVLELTFPLTPRPTLERVATGEPALHRLASPLSSPTKSALDGSTVIAHFEYKYCVTSAPAREFRVNRWENGTNRSFTVTTKRAEGTRHFKLADSWQE